MPKACSPLPIQEKSFIAEKGSMMVSEKLDKQSFILGMITAFCECVAGDCKHLALSPPLSHSDYDAVSDEAMER